MISFILLIIGFIGGQILSFSFSNIRISALDISVGIFILWALMQRKLQIKLFWQYGKIFGPFIVTCLVSLGIQIIYLDFAQILISSLYLWRFVLYSLLTMVISQDNNLTRINIWGLWWGGVIIGFLGLVQYFLYPNLRNLQYLGWDPHQYRVFSTFLDPNFTGIILVLTLILSFYLYSIKFKKNLIISGSVIAFIALLLTYSRGSYLALIASMVGMIMLIKKISIIWRIGLIGVVGLVFIGFLFLLPRPGGEGVNLLRIISVESRLNNNLDAFQLFLSSPILGKGFDTLRYNRTNFDEFSHSAAGFHNSWLFLLATTGIFGLISYLWIWWKILSQKFLNKKLLIITCIVILIHSQFDNSLFYPYVMFWMWMMVGSILNKYLL